MNQLAYGRVLAGLDPLARRLGKYTAYELARNEYVGSVFYSDAMQGARGYLEATGYEPNKLAAAKLHPEPHSAVAHASYRRVPDKHPVAFRGREAPRIVNDYAPGQCQYHVHAWPTSDGVEYYSHYEVRPDLRPVDGESLREAVGRLREHYRPETGETYLRGVTDLEI